MTPSPPLQLELVEQGRLVFLRLSGPLDERNALGTRTPPLLGKKLVINLEKVTQVTTLGVRDWIAWVEALEAAENALHFMRASTPVMAQIKRVRNFTGADGHLVSFQAPYHCATCSTDHAENILSSMLTVQGGPPVAVCDDCGEAMEFDEPLEAYAEVMRRHSARPVDAEVFSAIGKFGDGHLATAVAALHDISSGRLSTPSRYLTPPRGVDAPGPTPKPDDED